MADTIKSALFVDYDSFHRIQDDGDGDVAERIAQTSVAWVAAIEAGKLTLPTLGTDTRRRVLIRRCYADPGLLGLNRSALIAGGFEVVDCPQQAGRKRNAADIHMAIDTLDALEHPAAYDEFILLSADADFTPVLLRLRAHNRNTIVYGDEAMTNAYKAITDGVVDAGRFALVLAGEPLDAPPEPVAVEATPAGDAVAAAAAPDRADIEALARKVHAATNVPMFSPRTFADLFRLLAQEIGENGYHFQNTAENVTDKLIAAGRNVNRRQVLFVVKGLALKGHVFSTTDTPERLAEVFREQVFYLIGNSGIELEEREKTMLPAWILGRTPTVVKPLPTATPPRPQAPVDDAARKTTPPVRRRVPPRQGAPEKEVLPQRTPAPARSEAPRSEPIAVAPPPAAVPPPAARTPATPPGRPAEPPRPSVASRFAAITKGSFGAKPGPSDAGKAKAARPVAPTEPVRPAPRPAAVASPKAASPGPTARPAARAPAAKPSGVEGDALESSILAAIAQAVDVLVDDGADNAVPAPAESRAPVQAAEVDLEIDTEFDSIAEEAMEAEPAPPQPPPDPEPSPGGDSEDIGDEIQRIIASYSRARQQGD